MKKLLIIGAGDFGRELLVWAKAIHDAGKPGWQLAGYLDANPRALDGFGIDLPVHGDPRTWQPEPDQVFACAISKPVAKLEICRGLAARGASFVNLIHPTAIVGPHCQIGTGCVFCPGVIVTTHATIGDFVTLNLYTTVGHDAVIGDGCTTCSHVDITGHAQIGEGVFFGSHAAVVPFTRVGDYATIGAGSVAMREIPPRITAFGLPARPT